MKSFRVKTVILAAIFCGTTVFAFLVGPRWLERHKQRQEVFKRVETYGGWEKLRQNCESIASSSASFRGWQSPGTGTSIYHFRDKPSVTNTFHEEVPPQFAALKPQTVYYHRPEASNEWPEGNIKAFNTIPVFQIGFFGTQRAFGVDNSNAFYGIEVACGTNADIYYPRPPQFSIRNRWFPIDGHAHYREIAKGIFEIY